MRRVLGSLVLLCAACVAGCQNRAIPEGIRADAPLVVIRLESMSCAGCAATVEEELQKLAGVEKVVADAEAKLVYLNVDRGQFSAAKAIARLDEIAYAGGKVEREAL